ncbi:MAG: murein transglycosylase A [Beijerinckiaceae bacterium]
MQDILARAPADFDPVGLDELPGYSSDPLVDGWRAFLKSCQRLLDDQCVLRSACPVPDGLFAAAELAIRRPQPTESEVRAYFSGHFSAFRIRPRKGSNPYPHGFVTGYFEPEALGSRVRAVGFQEPVRGRPPDLENIAITLDSVTYSASRVGENGRLAPYWSRAQIDAGASAAPTILWLPDAIELFMIQVQGSARVVLPDGSRMRLVYDGRNGHPYESIGRILVSEGHLPISEMSLNSLKAWVRNAGQRPGEPGRALLHRNPSYVFFRLVEETDPAAGPIGGEGIPLTKLRSLAIDRAIWSYGLPFWVSGRLPADGGAEAEFQKLMIAQDTGSAIIGAARGDIFFGSGDAAGQTAARVRHEVEMFVLLPKT